MDSHTFNTKHVEFFFEDLHRSFIGSGFEIIEEPYFDSALYGFRATYIRRYIGHEPMPIHDQLFTTLLQVVGLPFGRFSQKMVIISSPKTINNETISEAIKLRVHFDDDTGKPRAIFGEQKSDKSKGNPQLKTSQRIYGTGLSAYIAHIIETISPGLIQLPIEMKLEILKKLNIESIIRMSKVNNEFKSLIFTHGETLWRHLCARDYNITRINRRIHKSWAHLYKDLYILDRIETCRKSRALTAAPELLALPPAPGRLPIEWPLHVNALAMPYYPVPENENMLALELFPRRRSDSVGSLL